MTKQTFAERLAVVMQQKNISPTELERLSGVKRQSITYILNNNLESSKLSTQLALALNVSHEWLSNGIEDQSFVPSYEILVFSDIYILVSYLMTGNSYNINTKSITHSKHLSYDAFVFHPSDSNIYYYCSKNQKLKSSKYLALDVKNNKFEITEKYKEDGFHFPIVEIKHILVG